MPNYSYVSLTCRHDHIISLHFLTSVQNFMTIVIMPGHNGKHEGIVQKRDIQISCKYLLLDLTDHI